MPRRLAALSKQTRPWPLWARYLATTTVVLLALGLRRALLGPGPGYPYLTAFPAVIVAGLVFDRGCAFLAVVLSAALGVYRFVAPTDTFLILNSSDVVALVVFVATSVFLAALVEDLHAAVLELTEANRRLAAAETAQAVLRREAAHRRHNDLQRLIATLRLQAQGTPDEGVRAALDAAIARTQALARVDARFERHQGDTTVDTHDLLVGLIEDLSEIGGAEMRPVTLEIMAEAHEVSREQAIPLGLVATELVTNALKYAFPGMRAGTVSVGFRREGEDFVLTVADDGVGFDPAAPPQGTGLGGRLVRALVSQLGGRVEVRENDARGGTACIIPFPVRLPRGAASVAASLAPRPAEASSAASSGTGGASPRAEPARR